MDIQQTGSGGDADSDKDDPQTVLPSTPLPDAGVGQLAGGGLLAAPASLAASQSAPPSADAPLMGRDRSGSSGSGASGSTGRRGTAATTLQSEIQEMEMEIQERIGRPPNVNWISPPTSAPSPFASAAAMPFMQLEACSRQVSADVGPAASRSAALPPAVAQAAARYGPGSLASTLMVELVPYAQSAGSSVPAAACAASAPADSAAGVGAGAAESTAAASPPADPQQQQQQQQQQMNPPRGASPTRGGEGGAWRSFVSSSSNSKTGHASSDSVSSWRCPPGALGSLEATLMVTPPSSPAQVSFATPQPSNSAGLVQTVA